MTALDSISRALEYARRRFGLTDPDWQELIALELAGPECLARAIEILRDEQE